ncbi:hypothetical protein PAMP_020347 [Pampus punctatissimus]
MAELLSRLQERLDVSPVHPKCSAKHLLPFLPLPVLLGDMDRQSLVLQRDQQGPPAALHRLHTVKNQAGGRGLY